ncbi:MAG: ThuA domain-containing protein [Saprospiraceae bacterium]
MKNLLFLLWLTCISGALFAQDMVLPLFPEGIPCASENKIKITEVNNGSQRRIRQVQNPEIAVYLPAKSLANGTGVVICPGGGYTALAWDWEGSWMAKWFNEMGVAAFVLKYRLPGWESEECNDKVALMDAQRAIRLVRSKATEWQLDPEHIGIMGFSAGGHLASTASTHFDKGDATASILVDRFSSRPDFSILMYPVISMDTTIAHMGTRNNVLGKNPSAELEANFSNEKQVTAETPPTILIHADNDRAVLPENSIAYYLALRKYKVPAALHIYQSGGHGFSFAEGKGDVEGWPEVCKDWLEARGLLKKRLKALIIDGQNNHTNWPETTPILRQQLEETGLFVVDVATTPPTGESLADFRPPFAAYDLVISNYNGEPWPEATQKDFEQYIHGGGGFVSVHAADNAFPKWQAYNEIIGLGGWGDRTEKDGPYVYINDKGETIRDESPGNGGHHGKRHEFQIKIQDAEHPITKGMPETWLHPADELYDLLRGPAENMHILATAFGDPEQGGQGRHEPMMMTIHYGLGRIFHTTLGHFNESQLCIGFKTSFQRAAEWVATGAVTQAMPADFPTAEKVLIDHSK